MKMKFREFEQLGIYVNEKHGKWIALSDYGDMQQEIIEKEGLLTLKNTQDNKELDEIIVPLKIDPEELMKRMVTK